MSLLKIEATENSPEVLFDYTSNTFVVKGKSVVSEVDEFYAPVVDWLRTNAARIKGDVDFVFDLDYFNIFSSKRILFLLYTLSDIREQGVNLKITWYFSQEDDDMKEVGEDYACMVNIPFDFISKTESAQYI